MEKMPNLYRVKWKSVKSGKYRYGIVSTFGEDVESQWNDNRNILIEDAITPTAKWVNYDKTEIVPLEFSYPIENDEYDLYVEEQLVKAQDESNDVTGLVGKMFTVPVADGCSYYVVVKENKKTVKIEWRGFCLDRYVDEFLGYGGTFDKDRIEPLINRQEAMAKLFAEHRKGA